MSAFRWEAPPETVLDEVILLLTDEGIGGTYGRFTVAKAALTVAWLELGLRWLHDHPLPPTREEHETISAYYLGKDMARSELMPCYIELGLRWLHDRSRCECSSVAGVKLVCKRCLP